MLRVDVSMCVDGNQWMIMDRSKWLDVKDGCVWMEVNGWMFRVDVWMWENVNGWM